MPDFWNLRQLACGPGWNSLLIHSGGFLSRTEALPSSTGYPCGSAGALLAHRGSPVPGPCHLPRWRINVCQPLQDAFQGLLAHLEHIALSPGTTPPSHFLSAPNWSWSAQYALPTPACAHLFQVQVQCVRFPPLLPYLARSHWQAQTNPDLHPVLIILDNFKYSLLTWRNYRKHMNWTYISTFKVKSGR